MKQKLINWTSSKFKCLLFKKKKKKKTNYLYPEYIKKFHQSLIKIRKSTFLFVNTFKFSFWLFGVFAITWAFVQLPREGLL